jgi:catechol 2,3-dioxygenase-like lactoylglutathione lyase family enzyme
MPTTVVEELNVLALYVEDMEKTRAFYAEHLGFEHVENIDPGILMKAGEVALYIEGGHAGNGPSALAGYCPCFAAASVRSSYEALSAAGVTISAPFQEFGPSFALFRIADPDGNQIEFAGAP